LVSWSSILDFLASRRGLLDAVVFSGGEPTLQPAILDAVKDACKLGFRVGLHTAGMNPECFVQSGYLLDATRPKLLWFYKFCKRNRLNLNCLLRQSIEQFAA
jgi:organic radical activating enzyme